MSAGTRIAVFERIRAEAEKVGHTALVAHIDRILPRERAAQELESVWAGTAPRSVHPDALPALDSQIDPVVSSIRDIAAGYRRGLPPGHAMVDAIDHLLATVFPRGVRAVTRLPYVDEIAAVEGILDKLTGELADTAQAIGLEPVISHLIELAGAYRELVRQGRDDLAFATVQEARRHGKQNMREVIALIAGQYFDSGNPDHVSRREALLAPIVDATDRVRAATRRRRQSGDGSESSAPGADSPPGAG